MKIAIITPYYKEDIQCIEKCITSVANQTMACDHFLISDGYPQNWIDGRLVRHIRLGLSHNDFGNTPRGIGAQIAISEGYDAIGFLDADNWLDQTHAQSCLDTIKSSFSSHFDCDYVIAQRRLIRPDLSEMHLPEDPNLVDTNCYLFLPGSFYLLPFWNLMPKAFSNVGDRIFYQKISNENLISVKNSTKTVNYLNLWEASYHALGEPAPANSKPNVDGSNGLKWLLSQTLREQIIAKRLLGLNDI